MSVVGEALRETGTSLRTVFRNPGLRNINLGFAGSAIGDWAYATAITVWAYQAGGVAAVGIWGTVRLLLMAVVTPFTSTLVDRYSRKWLMVSTDLIRATLITICSVLIWMEAPAISVFVIATITGLVATPFRPAVAALLPKLVTKPEELTAANGTSSTIDSLSIFAGPAIGGLLLTVASVPVVLLFNVLTFLWSAALVAAIKVDERRDPAETSDADGEDKVGFVREATEGFRTIFSHRDLLAISFMYCAQTIVAGASVVFAIEMAVQMTDFGATGVGYLDSVFGVGAILGGLYTLGRARANAIATDFGWGVIFWAVPLLLAAVVPSMWAAFAALAVMGFANPMVDVNAVTIVQRLSDDKVMGRVFGALESGLIGSMALGSVIMPLLILAFGLEWGLAILAVGIAAVVLPFFGLLRRLNRDLREPEGLRLLRLLPLFAPMEPKALELVAQQLTRVEVPAGEAVIREGDPGDLFYVVETGSLRATYQGRELSTQGPGDPFGEIALLRDVPRTATVTAEEPSVLWALGREDFLDAVTGNSEVTGQADDLVSRRIPTF